MTPNELAAIDFASSVLDLKSTTGSTTAADIDAALEQALALFDGDETDVSSDIVRKAIEQRFTVSFEDDAVVKAIPGASPWFSAADKGKWSHWWRYHDLLLAGRAPTVMKAMDETTDRIMSAIGNPKADTAFASVGIVYGDIQSGKTANMIALLSKAVSAGFEINIVLAGIEEDLRVQTQLRVDAGLIGASYRFGEDGTLTPFHSGVGEKTGETYATPLTSVEWDLEKKAGVPQATGDTLVFVVKKNPHILRNLLRLLRTFYAIKKGSADVADASLLLIDDECDWGSLDVSRKRDDGAEVKPSTINALIRELLALFKRSAYAGYTGTPFANLLISQRNHSVYGQDLFPRDFVILLPAPSNYLGVARLLGSKGSRLADAEERVNHQGLSGLIRFISDNDWVKAKHKITHVPALELPGSLREALDRFVINCALRPHAHNSMLVNLTRFQSVQDLVRDRIEARLTETVNALLSNDAKTWARLEHLYETGFKPLAKAIAATEPGECPLEEAWSGVRDRIIDIADTIFVKAIHGTSEDVLRYASDEPVRVIAVGGQKLSRGLTLEGLTISYFARPANNYDTTLQMGRWFGYRDGYLALCRLYIDQDTLDDFKTISDTCEALREHVSFYEGPPKDIDVAFAKSPVMHITDRNKRQNSVSINTSFAGRMPEAKIFHTDIATRQRNRTAVSTLIAAAGEASDIARQKNGMTGRLKSIPEGAHLYLDVGVRHILRFLDDYVTHETANVVRTENIADFITNGGQQGPDAFRHWNIGFMSAPPEPGGHTHFLDNGVGYTPRLRTPDENSLKIDGRDPDLTRYRDARLRYVLKRIVTEAHESIDVDAALAESFMAATDGSKKRTDWAALRNARDRTGHNGLLLIYPIVPEIVPEGGSPTRLDWTDRHLPYFGFAMVIPGQRRNAIQVMALETAIKRSLVNA